MEFSRVPVDLVMLGEDMEKIEDTEKKITSHLKRSSSMEVSEAVYLVHHHVDKIVAILKKTRLPLPCIAEMSSRVLYLSCKMMTEVLSKTEDIKKQDPYVLLFMADVIQTLLPALRSLEEFKADTPDEILCLVVSHAKILIEGVQVVLFRIFRTLATKHHFTPPMQSFIRMFDTTSCFGHSAPSLKNVFRGPSSRSWKKKLRKNEQDLSYLSGEDQCCDVCGEDMEEFAVLDGCRHVFCVSCAERMVMCKIVNIDLELFGDFGGVSCTFDFDDVLKFARCPCCRADVNHWVTSEVIRSEVSGGRSPLQVRVEDDMFSCSPTECARHVVSLLKEHPSRFGSEFLKQVQAFFADRTPDFYRLRPLVRVGSWQCRHLFADSGDEE